jgi:hypothetical protein
MYKLLQVLPLWCHNSFKMFISIVGLHVRWLVINGYEINQRTAEINFYFKKVKWISKWEWKNFQNVPPLNRVIPVGCLVCMWCHADHSEDYMNDKKLLFTARCMCMMSEIIIRVIELYLWPSQDGLYAVWKSCLDASMGEVLCNHAKGISGECAV